MWDECNPDKCKKEEQERMYSEDNYTQRMTEQSAAEDVRIEGVGQDAEIVVNEKGGKQSKSPMAMHLVDPLFLERWAINMAEELEFLSGDTTAVEGRDIPLHNAYKAIEYIAGAMRTNDSWYLDIALGYLEMNDLQQLIRIAKVLQEGADRYAPNNWRLIPEEEHINHALIHIIAFIAGDTQDNHIDHAMCRLMMAMATKKSENFEYGAYVA
jgi:hypothetical protein